MANLKDITLKEDLSTELLEWSTAIGLTEGTVTALRGLCTQA